MKEVDTLTFEEWVANGICIATSGGNIRVISLQASKIFYYVNQTFLVVDNTPILKELERGTKSSYLKEIFQKHYDWIQEQHQKWLKRQT